jgi:hypothetical protein
LLLQYCEEIFGKWMYMMELAAEENKAMECNDTELENGEMYVGENSCEEVAGKEFGVIGLEADGN